MKDRFEKLHVAAYKGFIQPKLVPVVKEGSIVDVKVEYPTNWLNDQMERSKNYSYLPANN